MIQGTGGFRKLRWIDDRRGKGKRGGLRLIYYYFPDDQQVWLMTLYDKDEKVDLNSQQKRLLKEAIGYEKNERLKQKRRKTK